MRVAKARSVKKQYYVVTRDRLGELGDSEGMTRSEAEEALFNIGEEIVVLYGIEVPMVMGEVDE